VTRVLVVEHGPGGHVAEVLRRENLDIDVLAVSDRLDEHLTAEDPQVVVHDMSRNQGADFDLAILPPGIPVMLIIDRLDEEVVLEAYAKGVAAVLGAQTGPREIVARVRALARRIEVLAALVGDVLTVGPVVLDRQCRRLTVAGHLVHVPRREFEIAEALMRRAGVVVPRQSLLRELWGEYRQDTKTLDVQVGRLRSRLAAAEGRIRIVTVRGVGYRFLTDDDLHRLTPAVEA